MKIIFKKATIEDTFEIIKEFYYQEELEVHPTKNYLFDYYYELKDIDKNLPKEEKDKIIFDIVKKRYEKISDLMDKQVIHFNELWSKYNDAFIDELSKYLNTSWHSFKDEIIGYVSPVPVFPRYPENLTFYFHPNIDDNKLIEVAAHESTHFLWFKKISEINNKKYNDYSHDEWEFSELVVDPILNSKEMYSVLHINEKAYDYFYEQELNGEKIMDHIKKIFLSEKDIDEKIKESYAYYKSFLQNKKRTK